MKAKASNKLFLYILFILLIWCLPTGLFSQLSVGVTGDTTINKCEIKQYIISIQNNSGNPLTALQVTGQLGNFTGFSYYYSAGFNYSEIDVDGTPICNGGGDNSEPVVSGTDLIWDIDTRCPNDSPFTLADGETLNISFWLQTDCSAVSGSLNVQFDYEIGGNPTSDNTGAMSIQVNPGAVNIRKEPNVIPQVLGQNVTWTIEVENSGLGVIENVEVTDALGIGLQYVSSSPASSSVAGGPGGEVVIWDSNDVPALASMNPGDVVSIDITATVIACDNLDNVADARWGCDPSPSNTCYNTASDGGTARAAVQHIPRTPLIDYTAPDITFNYCDDYVDISFPVNNIGDGTAYDVWTIIDFPGLTVSNVSAGATYNTGVAPPDGPRFEITDPIPPGGSYTLGFRLTASSWCGSPVTAGDLLWQKVYKDECDNLFYPPVELSQINAPTGTTGLSVGKTVVGGFIAIQIGTTISYDVTSAYSGSTSCGSPAGNAGLVTVTDTVPNGFTVTDAGGGVWTPGGGGTGGTIVWTYTPPASLNTTITLQAPSTADCETYCNTTFINSITATGVDCCGCTLNASDSETVAIECEEGVDSEKSASPTTGERCGQITYTNTYTFDDVAGNDSIDVSSLVFTENAEYEQQYFGGSLNVTIEDLSGGGPVSATACATTGITDTTPGVGGTFQVDFSGCGSFGTVRNKEIVITYTLDITEDTVTACAGQSFYSWSELDMGPTGSDCLANGIIHETAYVSIQPPSMSVSINNMNPILHKCEAQSIDVVLTQTSTVTDPKDVRLVLSGLNYYVTDVAGVTGVGVTPTSGTFIPTVVGDDYVWEFGDNFNTGNTTATITLNVRKRCTPGGALSATAYFDDTCNDDDAPDVYDDSCSTTGSASPSLLLSGDLLIEKTPETYYASDNTVQWKIYVTNRGTGTAYNVWVDDVMGSGLTFDSATVDAGVWAVNANVDHNSNAINGANITIDEIPAGIRREITFNATYTSCVNLTNDVTANWGCIGDYCQTDVTDTATISVPAPLVVHTNVVDTPVNACSSPQGYITIKNAGQITAYNIEITETLPAGLLYRDDSTRWRVYTAGAWGGWNGPSAGLYNPNPTTSPIRWTSTEIAGLTSLGPGERIEIEFDFDADCPFNGGTVTLATQYENPCGQVFNNADSNFTVNMREPDVTIVKTANNDVLGCTDLVTWTIDVTNDSMYMLEAIWLEDTIGDVYTYTSSTGDATYTGDNGTNAGQVTVWEIRNLPAGATATVTISASTDGPGGGGCNSDMDNTVRAWWGCGAVDGLSTTKPGEVGADSDKCLTSNLPFEETNTPTREPTVDFLGSIGLNPASIDSCNDSTQMTVTIDNAGRTDSYDLDLVITLPANLTYNANSVELCIGVDDSCVTAPIVDPTVTPGAGGTQVLTFYDLGDKANDIVNQLQAAGGNDTIVLKFTVATLCYTTADVDFDLYFYDCCGNNQYTTTESITLTADYPSLEITKTPATGQIDCATGSQEWTFTVTNNGTGNAQVVRVEDAPGAWLTMQMGTFNDVDGTGATIADLGGGVYGWEFTNLAAGNSVEFRVSTQLNPNYGLPPQANCNEIYRQNTATAVWGCGTSGDATDLNAGTTAYDCTDALPASLSSNPTLQMPNLVVTSITPNVSCTSDGSSSGTISVRVTNNGDSSTGGTAFTVEVTDGKGWTGTGTYSNNIVAGGFADVTIDVGSWNPGCNCAAPYSFNATVDLNGDICECSESDNTTGSATSYSPPIPDLTITDIDFTNVSCSSDGISGNVRVQVENLGCAAASNFQVALATDGCLTFTPQTVTTLGAGSSTWLTFNISGNWADCTSEDCDFTASVDGPGTVCECDGTNNSRTETYSTTLPDLIVTNIDYSNVSCSSDDVSGFVRVTVQNQGYGSAANFEVSLATDGCLVFAANQTVAGPLTNGQTASVDFPISGSWANPTDCDCDFTATVDATGVICECNGSNNDMTTTYNNPLPNLRVTSVVPTFNCTSDGSLTGNVAVTVDNNGCAAAGAVDVQLTSTGTYAFTNQSVTLAQGASTVLNFSFTPTSANCDVDFTAAIDPGAGTVCESASGDNSDTYSNFTPTIPDLRVDSDTLAVSCSSDGQIDVSGNITVANDGCGSFTTDIPVRYTLYDNSNCTGNVVSTWTATLGSVNINGSATQNFAVSQTITTDLVANSSGCQVSIGVELDYTNLICEFDGTNNDYCGSNIAVDIPDLGIQADSLGVTCTTDGNVQVSGNVTLVNDGCGSNMVTDVPVRFTLFSGANCTGTNLGQWTQTFSGMNIPAGGGTQVVGITPQTFATDLVTNSTGCEVSVQMEVDYSNTICESDSSDNTYCAANIPVDIPDLEVQGDTLALTATGDGTAQVSGNVTVVNNGCGSNMIIDIPVRFTVYDNLNCTGNVITQWTETFTSANIPAGGGTQAFTVTPQNLTGNYCTGSTGCQVSMRVELDYNGSAICESDGTDNDLCVNKNVSIPDLAIDAVASTITCLSDGSLTGTTVTVSNNGCADATNVTVRLASDCGLTFTDEIVNIPSGTSQDVFFPFASGITDCNCTFNASIDPDDTIDECDGANNTGTSNVSMLIPDLEVQSENLTITCADDGMIQVSGTVTLVNNGCGPNITDPIPMQFTLYGNQNGVGPQLHRWTTTFTGVDIPAGGGTQTFTIPVHRTAINLCTDSSSGRLSIVTEIDHTDSICEWDGTDNTFTANLDATIIDVEATSATASVTATGDGTLQSSFTVEVSNRGSDPITQDFYVSVDDGEGWTVEKLYNADLGGTLPLAPGATSTLAIDWNRTFAVSDCDFGQMTVQVDSQNQLCQCTTSNDTITTTFELDVPNLKPTAIAAGCSADGSYLVKVTVENDGCSDAGVFTLHLEDNRGNSQDMNVPGLASGASITMEFTGWTATCEPDTVTFTAVVDSQSGVSEITGSDNSMSYTHTDNSPDLVVSTVTPDVSCTSPGNLNGSIRVTVLNNGNAAVAEDFKVIVNDGEGWSTEQFYKAGLGGTLPIPVGGSADVRVNWNRGFNKEPFKCDFNNISVSLDGVASLCECAEGNNETVVTYSLPFPDLAITSLIPNCQEDGIQRMTATIGNQGCEDQTEDFSITFGDDTGQTTTAAFTSLGGTLPLKAGTEQTVNLDEWQFDCAADAMEYEAHIGLDTSGTGAVCDLNLQNNSYYHTHSFGETDLEVQDIDWTPNNDGSFTFTVTLANNGRSHATNTVLDVYDQDGKKVFSKSGILINAGTSMTTSFTTGSYPANQNITFNFVVDEPDNYCECDGSNNEKSITVNNSSTGTETPLKVTALCPPSQQQGGLFVFELLIENTSEGDLTDGRVENILPEGFTYVPGTSVLGGQQINDPQTGQPMVWQIGTIKAETSVSLLFSAVAGSDIDPGRYCTEAMVYGSLYGDAVTIDSGQVTCCVTVTPTGTGGGISGCCIDIEQYHLSPMHRIETPRSYIEPYFHTETAMFTAYASMNLWKNTKLEKGSMPRFMKERLQNYARATIEEFYLDSRLGLTEPDGSLWLSYAGAYPEKQDKDDFTSPWLRKQVDETMTVSQVAFELLALNEAVNAEDRTGVKEKLKSIIDKKLFFLKSDIHDLPHGWEIKEKSQKETEKLDASATLYDKASLYLAMKTLNKNGYSDAAAFETKLRESLKVLDNQHFDRNNVREEFLFILGLLQNGQADQAKAKVSAFEKILVSKDTKGHEIDLLKSLHDYALAAAVVQKAGGNSYDAIMKEMASRYYLKNTGVFAEKQPDLTFKLNLSQLAPLIMAFDSSEPGKQSGGATVLYRTFDEVGLFLKKRNLMVGQPLFSLLKNYPFSEPLLPVMSFTKANRSIAPVFSQNAVIHSGRLSPLGEAFAPGNYSKMLSPVYETDASRIAAIAYGMQHLGRLLGDSGQRVVKEDGRSFGETGMKYVDSLLESGAGIQSNGLTLLPFDDIAVKGPKQGEHNLEPLNAGTRFSSETLANYLLAEALYIDGNGKHADALKSLMKRQRQIVDQFKTTGYIPETFNLYIDPATGGMTLIPSRERASRVTAAKFYHLMPKDKEHKFLLSALKKKDGPLSPQDLVFLTSVPELVPYFKDELKILVDQKDSKVAFSAADIIGRQLLGQDPAAISRAQENLRKLWDKDAVLPLSDRVENIEKGLIYHHNPQQFILYLLASRQNGDFRFKRTLNYFSYLVENEWGVESGDTYMTLPSNSYQVFKEQPSDRVEPGDLLHFKVRVDNTCPDGSGKGKDLPSLYIKAQFTPSLIYAGTERVEGLSVLGEFQWGYDSFPEGSVLEYIYKVNVPLDTAFDFIDGWISVGGRQGAQDYGPDSGTGDRCEDIHHLQKLRIVPFEEIQGVVFEDSNVNGIKDVGEKGVPNILIKDTRGRMFRSDAGGRFIVKAGDKHEGVQIELKSIPANYLMIDKPTRLVNRQYAGEISFGLIPCKTVTGFVYTDENGNGAYDPGEAKPAGVLLKAKDKEIVTGADGRFTFRNLPEMWQQWIGVKTAQPYYKGDAAKLKFQLD